MDKLKLKKEILEAGKAKIEGIVNDFQERVNELKATSSGNDMQETASQSESRQGSDIELMDSLATHLDFAEKELETLNLIDVNTKHDKVEFGSVVITDKRNLFVSTVLKSLMLETQSTLVYLPKHHYLKIWPVAQWAIRCLLTE